MEAALGPVQLEIASWGLETGAAYHSLVHRIYMLQVGLGYDPDPNHGRAVSYK
jgi:hypothetical protein